MKEKKIVHKVSNERGNVHSSGLETSNPKIVK
jgi:hypothetical protein